MSSPRVWCALVFTSLALGGCQCEGEPKPDAGPVDAGETFDAGLPDAGSTVNERCSTLAEARCARETRCGFLSPTEQGLCLQQLTLECANDFRRVDAGAVRFDATAAGACLVALSSSRCAAGPFARPEPCTFHQLFTPAGLVGTHCEDPEDCAEGFCFGAGLDCRTCRAFAGLGEPCSLIDRRCDPRAAFCSQDGLPRTCQAQLADGTPCGSSRQCVSGWCNWRSQVPDAGPDVCGRMGLGERCGDPSDCASDAWCAGFTFESGAVTPGVCTPRAALGASCTNAPDDDGCFAPATCLEGRCTVVSPWSLDAGAECERLDDCEETHYCRDREALQPDGGRSLRSGVCAPRLSAGAPCSYTTYVDTDCEQATTCGREGRCVVRGVPDAGCRAGYECLDLLACPAALGRCAPLPRLGDACEVGGARCLEGWCGDEADAGLRCLPSRLEGADCAPLTPWECASQRCGPASAGAQPTCLAACFP